MIFWFVGFVGSFYGELIGVQNVCFVVCIYGVDIDELIDYVVEFVEFGVYYYQLVFSYLLGMKLCLVMGISMGIYFDIYLVDEVISVGDVDFWQKFQCVFFECMSNLGVVVVSYLMLMIWQMCDMGVVLDCGKLMVFDNLDEVIVLYEVILCVLLDVVGDQGVVSRLLICFVCVCIIVVFFIDLIFSCIMGLVFDWCRLKC